MKFVCNNCGFTADIPERMSACPMCGSSDVVSSAETSKISIPTDEHDVENVKSQKNSRVEGPTQRVTLTEEINAKETKPATQPKQKSSCKICVVLALALLVSAILAAAIVFFFFFK